MMKHICKITLLVIASIWFTDCLDKTSESKLPGYPKIAEKVLVYPAWAANKVSFVQKTVGQKQFVAYYDKNQMMTVESREIGSNNCQKTTLSNKLHWDSHNYVTITNQ